MQYFYRVQSGDTLYGIARRWGLPLENLIATNNLRSLLPIYVTESYTSLNTFTSQQYRVRFHNISYPSSNWQKVNEERYEGEDGFFSNNSSFI